MLDKPCPEWRPGRASPAGICGECGHTKLAHGQVAPASRILVDPDIADLNRQIEAWQETAQQEQRNTQYYRSLLVEIGNMFGSAARVSDDGSVQDSVLVAKVPQLVRDVMAVRGLRQRPSTQSVEEARKASAHFKRLRLENQEILAAGQSVGIPADPSVVYNPPQVETPAAPGPRIGVHDSGAALRSNDADRQQGQFPSQLPADARSGAPGEAGSSGTQEADGEPRAAEGE